MINAELKDSSGLQFQNPKIFFNRKIIKIIVPLPSYAIERDDTSKVS